MKKLPEASLLCLFYSAIKTCLFAELTGFSLAMFQVGRAGELNKAGKPNCLLNFFFYVALIVKKSDTKCFENSMCRINKKTNIQADPS